MLIIEDLTGIYDLKTTLSEFANKFTILIDSTEYYTEFWYSSMEIFEEIITFDFHIWVNRLNQSSLENSTENIGVGVTLLYPIYYNDRFVDLKTCLSKFRGFDWSDEGDFVRSMSDIIQVYHNNSGLLKKVTWNSPQLNFEYSIINESLFDFAETPVYETSDVAGIEFATNQSPYGKSPFLMIFSLISYILTRNIKF